jgi:hypothetical protein
MNQILLFRKFWISRGGSSLAKGMQRIWKVSWGEHAHAGFQTKILRPRPVVESCATRANQHTVLSPIPRPTHHFSFNSSITTPIYIYIKKTFFFFFYLRA